MFLKAVVKNVPCFFKAVRKTCHVFLKPLEKTSTGPSGSGHLFDAGGLNFSARGYLAKIYFTRFKIHKYACKLLLNHEITINIKLERDIQLIKIHQK